MMCETAPGGVHAITAADEPRSKKGQGETSRPRGSRLSGRALDRYSKI
jgi:hypothetical protein